MVNKKYCYKYDGKNDICHVFIEGIYAGFQDVDGKINSEYSPMVKRWVENKETETTLRPFLDDAGFELRQ